jgi:hypothetical protein
MQLFRQLPRRVAIPRQKHLHHVRSNIHSPRSIERANALLIWSDRQLFTPYTNHSIVFIEYRV